MTQCARCCHSPSLASAPYGVHAGADGGAAAGFDAAAFGPIVQAILGRRTIDPGIGAEHSTARGDEVVPDLTAVGDAALANALVVDIDVDAVPSDRCFDAWPKRSAV